MNHRSRIRAIADRDPNWAATLKAALDAKARFEQFMGDERAASAILVECAQSPCPVFTVSDMDVEDFIRNVLHARVDVRGMPASELARWGVI